MNLKCILIIGAISLGGDAVWAGQMDQEFACLKSIRPYIGSLEGWDGNNLILSNPQDSQSILIANSAGIYKMNVHANWGEKIGSDTSKGYYYLPRVAQLPQGNSLDLLLKIDDKKVGQTPEFDFRAPGHNPPSLTIRADENLTPESRKAVDHYIIHSFQQMLPDMRTAVTTFLKYPKSPRPSLKNRLDALDACKKVGSEEVTDAVDEVELALQSEGAPEIPSDIILPESGGGLAHGP